MNAKSLDHFSESAFVTKETEGVRILIYSPSMSFCLGWVVVLQDRFETFTSTDPDMLFTFAKTFEPDVIILEILPSQWMMSRLQSMKTRMPNLRIILFHEPRVTSVKAKEELGSIIDAVVPKSKNINEITQLIDGLVRNARSERVFEVQKQCP